MAPGELLAKSPRDAPAELEPVRRRVRLSSCRSRHLRLPPLVRRREPLPHRRRPPLIGRPKVVQPVRHVAEEEVHGLGEHRGGAELVGQGDVLVGGGPGKNYSDCYCVETWEIEIEADLEYSFSAALWSTDPPPSFSYVRSWFLAERE